ncbi:MAG TPA: DUF2283 domain-containing protein [Lacipirellulaceae bacterium]
MTVKYFPETDTALLEFSNRLVEETREISENIYVDLDKDGNLVSMTSEHANKAASLPKVTVQEFEQANTYLAVSVMLAQRERGERA